LFARFMPPALVAAMLGSPAFMIERDEINLGDPSSEGFRPKAAATNRELRKSFEEGVEKGPAALQRVIEEHLMKPWRFMTQGRAMAEELRYVILANGLLSHLANHRGPLTV
jgi:hypothetical protein